MNFPHVNGKHHGYGIFSHDMSQPNCNIKKQCSCLTCTNMFMGQIFQFDMDGFSLKIAFFEILFFMEFKTK